MSENQTEIQLLKRIEGEPLTGTPVYTAVHKEESISYHITIIPPSTIHERIYKAHIRIEYPSINETDHETYWGLKMSTVIKWIENLLDAEIVYSDREDY